MGLSLITPATGCPVEVEEAKRHIRIEFDDDDYYVEMLIGAACDYAFGIEGWTGRALINETYSETFDTWQWNERGATYHRNGYNPLIPGTSFYELNLTRSKVQSVVSVVYLDSQSGLSTTLDPSQYILINDKNPGKIVPAYNVSWPIPLFIQNAITVQYVAGFGSDKANVPNDLRLAIAQLAAHWYEHREGIMVDNRAVAISVPDMYDNIFRKYQVRA